MPIAWELDSPNQVSEGENKVQYLLLPSLSLSFQHTGQPYLVWEGTIQVSIGILAKRQECLEGSLEPGYYSSKGKNYGYNQIYDS